MTLSPVPPRPPKRPTVLRAHGDERGDEWYWLREKDNPEVIAHLEAENAFTGASLAHTEGLQKIVYDEIVSRIQETDLSVPVRRQGWWYYARSVEGLQYPIHCRCPAGSADTRPPGLGPSDAVPDEQILLDENREATGHDFFELGGLVVSPDHGVLAWASDTAGGERYTLRFRDLASRTDLADVVEGTYYGLAWANDNRTIFYTRPNDAMRPFQVWRHHLGRQVADDVLVFQEDDERFYVGVGRTKDDALILVAIGSKITSEVRFLDANDALGELRVVAPREQGVEYEVDHRDGRFVIVTNADGAENFKLVEAPTESPDRSHWTPVLPYDPSVRLQAVDVFASHLALHERADGQLRIRIVTPGAGDPVVLEHPDPVHSVWIGDNPTFDTCVLRFQYTSMVTPMSVYEIDMVTGDRVQLKQQPVLGGYLASDYRTSREWAVADDGTRVPISVVSRADMARDGTAPCLLYGYGSYEASMDPTFSPFRLSLLDRGFVFAIAHVRGGGEMGRGWYEDGKLLNKKHTFTDFISAASHLIDAGWTAPDRLVARGGSAGGLLMGAVVNLRPDLFAGIVAQVPFVDCLTTILDESLPLTALEWEEWGNPVSDPDVYAYMKSYSPYDCVSGQAYPPMLVTAGLNDPRVSYWEPAKWVARLRDRKIDDNRVLLKTEMGAGHMGPSGRYDAWRDEALVLSFIIDTATSAAPG